MKIYEAPTLEVTKLDNDIVTVSVGDTPFGDGYEWQSVQWSVTIETAQHCGSAAKLPRCPALLTNYDCPCGQVMMHLWCSYDWLRQVMMS